MVSQIRIFGFVIKDSEKPKTKKIKKVKKIKKTKSYESEGTDKGKPDKGKPAKDKPDVEIAEIKVYETKEKDVPISKNKNGLIEKIKKVLRKIKEALQRVPEFFVRVKKRLLNIIKTKDNVIRRFSLIRGYIKKEENKLGFKRIWWATKKLCKHILPKKLKMNIRFGTGDPCSTGQVLGVLGITYHLYQKNATIIPDFTEEVYEGDVLAKGRIRFSTILIICIRVILDRNFRQLLKGFSELKEEL